jgi:hypothetical protein
MVDSFDDHAAGNGVKCCVYWLFDETCSVPENDGYVGISTDLPQRLREHKSKSRRTWTGVEVLFVGTVRECLEREIGYRPFPGIGWNSNSGGTSGKMLATETRKKLSRWQLGSKRPGHSKTMKEIHAHRSPEEKARLAEMYGRLALGNKSRTGQKFSAEERAKLSAAKIGNRNAVGNKNAVGHVVSQELREAISRRMKGKQTRLGAKLSDETKAKISASQKRRLVMRRISRELPLGD